jgi:tetratricopeptide (TPR) repeat protein
VDKIAVPANVLAAMALVGFMALGMPFLRAGQTTVTVEDEEGNAIERVVPTERLRQRLAVFFFDNDSGDPALDDLVQGLNFLVQYDLSQDQVMSLVGAQQLWGDLWRVSPEDPLDIPPAARRELAEDFRCPHYVSGAFACTGEDWSLTMVLQDTRTSRERARHAYCGPDLFALVDQATVDLRRDLGVPEWHLAETPDLPVADITSRDPEAFRDFLRAVQALMLRNDYGEAERHGLAAVERDPRFGLAWFQLMQVYANGGQGRYEEAWERYERVVLLEPDNTDARLRLADLRDRQGRFDEALVLLDEAEREGSRSWTGPPCWPIARPCCATLAGCGKPLSRTSARTPCAANTSRPSAWPSATSSSWPCTSTWATPPPARTYGARAGPC